MGGEGIGERAGSGRGVPPGLSSSSAGSGLSSGTPKPCVVEGGLHHVLWGGIEATNSSSSGSGRSARPTLLEKSIPENAQAPPVEEKGEEESGSEQGQSRGKGSMDPVEMTPEERQKALDALRPGERFDRKATWSAGSEQHEAGACKPCAWVWKPSGCENGQLCTFCHACDENQFKSRKKEKIARMRADKRGGSSGSGDRPRVSMSL